MKKIITTTFHNANNYGAVLQAYALQQTLLKKYNTEILDYYNPLIANNNRLFKKYQGTKKEKITQIVLDTIFFYKNIVRNRHFNQFRNNFLITSKRFRDANSVTSGYPKADAYITGSDQIWNPILTDGIDQVYTLNFGNHDFRKIAYAASAGENSTLSTYRNKLLQSLQTFDSISVREKPLYTLLKQELKQPITITLDPSLLLTKTEWEHIGNSAPIKEQEKYILVYSVGGEPALLYQIANRLSRQTGYRILHPKRRDLKHCFVKNNKSYYTYGPEDFINLVANAEYIITTSFHGTAFATIFNKKFFVVLAKYSDRITTLLNSLNISNRIVSSEQEFDNALKEQIDWKKVNQLIQKKRTESIDWIYNAIEK